MTVNRISPHAMLNYNSTVGRTLDRAQRHGITETIRNARQFSYMAHKAKAILPRIYALGHSISKMPPSQRTATHDTTTVFRYTHRDPSVVNDPQEIDTAKGIIKQAYLGRQVAIKAIENELNALRTEITKEYASTIENCSEAVIPAGWLLNRYSAQFIRDQNASNVIVDIILNALTVIEQQAIQIDELK